MYKFPQTALSCMVFTQLNSWQKQVQQIYITKQMAVTCVLFKYVYKLPDKRSSSQHFSFSLLYFPDNYSECWIQ